MDARGVIGGLSALVLVQLGAPQSADACGGLFCDAQQPVNQEAERIIFAKHDDGTVTAVVEIQYSGPAESFAWVLPVPGIPEVQVSSTQALDRLQQQSNPVYTLNTMVEGQCDDVARGGSASAPTADAGDFDEESAADDGGGVVVLASGTVGPFDFEVIQVTAEDDPAQVAVDWLVDNGYDLADLPPEVLGDYLADGMNLLAFRLSKDSDTGSIRPIVINYETDEPMIPIKPTAVAVEPDMGILVWVLGDARAVPTNYKSLILNEALIDWFNPMNTYEQVVTLAADAEGVRGQGFVTEQASDTENFMETVFPSWEQQDWTNLVNNAGNLPPTQLLEEALRFSFFDGWLDVIRTTVPIPDGFSAQDVAECPSCMFTDLEGDIEGFDRQMFIDAMRDEVIQPMLRTQGLIDAAGYITRLFTTMSAVDMTEDPLFDINPELDDVSNFHQANRIIECSPGLSQADAPWRVELAQGDVVRGMGMTWPIELDGTDQPVNLRIVQHAASGTGEVVTDNSTAIDEALQEANSTVPGGGGAAAGSASGGCSALAGGRPGWALAWLLLGAGVLALRRRRAI